MKGSPMQRNFGISPTKLRPSYISGEMVSDSEADLMESLPSAHKEKKTVTRKGESEVINIKKKAKGSLDDYDKDAIKEADKWSANPENRSEQVKSWKLNNPGFKLVDGKKVKI